ncbi:hypothetical protein HMPREF0549_1504, partial [Limosilactobacillus vaginalis DSM 5837 = ATCC 49540]
MWVARYRKYEVQGLEICSLKYDYYDDFKLTILNLENTRLRTH